MYFFAQLDQPFVLGLVVCFSVHFLLVVVSTGSQYQSSWIAWKDFVFEVTSYVSSGTLTRWQCRQSDSLSRILFELFVGRLTKNVSEASNYVNDPSSCWKRLI